MAKHSLYKDKVNS